MLHDRKSILNRIYLYIFLDSSQQQANLPEKSSLMHMANNFNVIILILTLYVNIYIYVYKFKYQDELMMNSVGFILLMIFSFCLAINLYNNYYRYRMHSSMKHNEIKVCQIFGQKRERKINHGSCYNVPRCHQSPLSSHKFYHLTPTAWQKLSW